MAVPAQAAAVQVRPLVELRESGGFAGVNDRVVVYTNGCVRLSKRTGPVVRKCVTVKEWRGLRAKLTHLRLGRNQAQPQGADHLKYTLAYKGRTVTRYTLTTSWAPVVSRMEKLLQRYWAPD
ncbi:hypothetical protein OIE66_19100 [Nonomuraea sp. NBC_01738]|uniref:hypothetical protein n=1 Tax=Nonomuraea sp. NBC_01738 TaxID=2976003 RepID=UPI002E14CC18|nr:hypothetical protein OIE66_19100 [Nonomuraea sp. NBC_01738]